MMQMNMLVCVCDLEIVWGIRWGNMFTPCADSLVCRARCLERLFGKCANLEAKSCLEAFVYILFNKFIASTWKICLEVVGENIGRFRSFKIKSYCKM